MEKRFKVVRVDSPTVSGIGETMDEEAKELAKVNAELVRIVCPTEDKIIEAAKDADIVLDGGSHVTRRVIEALPKCKAIVTYGAGYDSIDVDAATDNGVLVINMAAYNAEEVSNHAMTMLLACAKRLVLLNSYTKQGRWMKRPFPPMVPIYGQTLGIIGCGNVGRLTAKKAQGFGLKILGYDPYVNESLAKEYGITLVSLPELIKDSDFISIHSALSKETWHLIGEKEFKQMKPNTYFINTARGSIVDELALIKALQEKWIAGAGIDAFEKEPTDANNPLLKMDNVVVTPHFAGYSDASFKRREIWVWARGSQGSQRALAQESGK